MTRMIKYSFYLSLLLNGILLMILAGVVPFLLYLSILANLLFVWFIFKSIKKLSDLEEDTTTLMSEMEIFLEKLENIHSMEMYYGDVELQNLINNSKILVNNFIDIQEKYFDVEVTLEPDDEDTAEGAEETKEEQLFYKGS